MKICKDCFHWEACREMFEAAGGFIVPDDFKGSAVRCKHFVSTADVAPRAEWISVEERLPEPYTWVTVYNPNCIYTKIDADEIVGGNWVRHCGKVTHWMPLPEPPGMKGGAE